MTWSPDLSSLLESVGPLLFDSAIKGAVVICAALALITLMRRSAAAWRHLAWSLTALSLLVVPLLSNLLPSWQIAVPGSWLPTIREDASVVSAVSVGHPETTEEITPAPIGGPPNKPRVHVGSSLVPSPAGRPVPDSSVVPARSTTDDGKRTPNNADAAGVAPTPSISIPALLRWLSALWLLGVTIALIGPCVGLWQLVRLERRAEQLQHSATLHLLARLQARLKIRRQVRLITDQESQMPLTWGFLHPALLLPNSVLSREDSLQRMILLHELAHIKRFDWLTQMISHFACALHWFNPLVWYAARRMLVEREQACDDIVLSTGSQASNYAAELLHLAHRSQPPRLLATAAIPVARRSSLEQRVVSILDRTRRRAGLSGRGVFGGTLLCLAIVAPIAMLRALPDEETAEEEPSKTITVTSEAGRWSMRDGVTLVVTHEKMKVAGGGRTLLDQLARHPHATSRPLQTEPTVARLGASWDQSSSEVRIRRSGKETSLLYQSKSSSERPQAGMSDQQWTEIRDRWLNPLLRRSNDSTPKSLDQLLAAVDPLPPVDPLDRAVSLSAKNVPLIDVLNGLCEQADLELFFDTEALESLGLDPATPVTVTLAKEPLRRALQRTIATVRRSGIYYYLEEGDKLVVTSFAAWLEQRRAKLPEWLRPLYNNGLVAGLEGDRVVSLSIGDVANNELLEKLKTLPHLRELDIQTSKEMTAAELAHIGNVQTLDSLSFYMISLPNPDDLKFLGKLKSLRELSLTDAMLIDDALEHISQLGDLRVLKLGGNLLSDGAMQQIAKLKNLEVLAIPDSNWVNSGMSITDAGLAHIADLTNLRELDVSGLGITDEGFQQLKALIQMRRLRINGSRIEGGGLATLANYQQLESLVLGGAALSDEAMQHVGKCRNLRTLHLLYTSVTDEGFQEIAKLDKLERLSLDSYHVTDAGMAHLNRLKNLKHIELRASKVGDQTLAHLSQITSLTRLDLSGSGNPGVSIGRNFTGTGYAHLADLPNLKSLYLNNADVMWTELSALKQLKDLHLMMPTMTHENVRALQKALPNTSVSAMWGGSSIGPDGERGL